jgi:hypothetical protein
MVYEYSNLAPKLIMSLFYFLKPTLQMKKCDWATIMTDENYNLLKLIIRNRYHEALDILRYKVLETINSDSIRYDYILEFLLPSHSCKQIILRFLYSWKHRQITTEG